MQLLDSLFMQAKHMNERKGKQHLFNMADSANSTTHSLTGFLKQIPILEDLI